MPSGARYNAACYAALAGCGHGKDADRLDEKERAGWRRQALDWLRADLSWWGKALDNSKAKISVRVDQTLRHWQTDAQLSGVRDKESLNKLPADERTAWQRLWQEVAALRERAGQLK